MLFGGGDAVDLGNVAGREFLNATVVSGYSALVTDVLLCKRNLGGQFLGLVNLAQLRQDIDLLNSNWQQLGLFFFFAKVRECIAQILRALETHLGLSKLVAGYAAACRIEGRFEDFQIFTCGLLLLRELALPSPFQLRVYSSRVDADIVLFAFDVLVCEFLVNLGGLREVLGSVCLAARCQLCACFRCLPVHTA